MRSGSSSSSQLSPPIPFLFPLFIQFDGCLFPIPVLGLMDGLPEFSSHERNLHQGAGCQKWKLRDVSGTQPPISDAVVNLNQSTSYLLISALSHDLFVVKSSIWIRPIWISVVNTNWSFYFE